ncbi:MAG TPA: aspartate aminotransferase family protein, partial [Polyangiaceae bacterium]|nr:aspartate aminotransferase family protein [Polyangiaceae bacterium]
MAQTSPKTPAAEASTVTVTERTSAAPPTMPSFDEGHLDTEELLRLADAHLYKNYRPAPVVFVRGEGSSLEDSEGKRYLDFAAGVAVTALGHAHPRLVRAIAEQAAKLVHVSNYFFNEENVLLAKELCDRTGFDRAFFCNSGAEANEAMLKLARRHFYAQGDRARFRVIAFDNAFHGRTIATVNLTGTPAYKEGFGPPLEGVTHVPYGDLDAVAKAMGPDVCGIIVEPVQGEGGVLPAPPGFLAGLRALADEHGALLLVDEIQTGMGRTGTLLGFEHAGIRPDVITLAKGLGGGVPIGAMLCTERLGGALPPGTHGSTFGGNPLACAASRAVLAALYEDGLIEGARAKGAHLGKRLSEIAAKHPDLCEGERGVGLLRGLVMKKGVDGRAAIAQVREEGVLCTVAGGRVLRFTPPLVVTEAEIDDACARIDRAIS